MFLNPAYDPAAVPAPSRDALSFHRGLDGYAPTPVRMLSETVGVKDESGRLGLPAFKILGASWAIERALRDEHTLPAPRDVKPTPPSEPWTSAAGKNT